MAIDKPSSINYVQERKRGIFSSFCEHCKPSQFKESSKLSLSRVPFVVDQSADGGWGISFSVVSSTTTVSGNLSHLLGLAEAFKRPVGLVQAPQIVKKDQFLCGCSLVTIVVAMILVNGGKR